jgi:GNAT superfamily N-acetyltransferase
MKIVGPYLHREDECMEVLRSLPMWFGIEEALLMYARDSGTHPTFALESDQRIRGFITLQQHFPEAWEVHCMAMAAEARNEGHGTRLLLHAEGWLRTQGARYLQVKTVADASPSKEYGETRKFYVARGFTPLEAFPTLWSPRNPALQLIKVLGAA